MAHKKASGKTHQKTSRSGKRLGLKVGQNQLVSPGNILIRQRGSKFHPGRGVKMGKDYTIFAIEDGRVNFRKRQGQKIVEVVRA